MSDAQIDGYAAAIYEIARADGVADRVGDELFRFSRTVESAPELRSALTDPGSTGDAKARVVEELLRDKAHPTTIRVLGLIVDAGLGRELSRLIDAVNAKAAAAGGAAVAEVRVATPISEEQRQRLASALSALKGRNVDVKVIIDPAVLGGVVTTIGDEVIDGSVRHRLEQLRANLVG